MNSAFQEVLLQSNKTNDPSTHPQHLRYKILIAVHKFNAKSITLSTLTKRYQLSTLKIWAPEQKLSEYTKLVQVCEHFLDTVKDSTVFLEE